MSNTTQDRAGEQSTAEKKAEALAHRKQGHAYWKIGELMGISEQYAGNLVREALKDIYREDAKDILDIEIARLDELYNESMKVLSRKHLLISAGMTVLVPLEDENGEFIIDALTMERQYVRAEDMAPKLAAIKTALSVMERRAKMLGLDKPTKTAFTNPEGDEVPVVQFYIPDNGRTTQS